jgi:hypothetical protein
MPYETNHYKLEAHKWGDVYSARVDRRRFTAIDNLLAFYSDQIQNGVIQGWDIEVSDLSSLLISISPGMGMIEGVVSSTFADIELTVLSTSYNYIYMKNKLNENGGYSGYSNIESLTHSDTTPPSAPSGLSINSSLMFYNQVSFTWDSNTEVDFSHYVVERALDDPYEIVFTVLNNNVTDNIYTDSTGLVQDTQYIYRVSAVDFSGNISLTSQINISTLVDMRIPTDPLFIQAFIGDTRTQIIWDISPSENVDEYLIEIVEKDNPDVIISSHIRPHYYNDEFKSQLILIENLQNNIHYQATVYTISISGYQSDGIKKTFVPLSNNCVGFVTINNDDVSFTKSLLEGIEIETNIEWEYGLKDIDDLDPYEDFVEPADPDYFSIVLVESGIRFSEPIEIPFVSGVFDYSKNIFLLPFINDNGEQIYESFKQYTPYLVIVQVVDQDGDVSLSSVIRINRSPIYTEIESVSDVSIERSSKNNIICQWTNPQSEFFSHIIIDVDIIDLFGTEGGDISYASRQDIRKSTEFVIPFSYFSSRRRYTFSITAVDVSGKELDSYNISKQFLEENDTTERVLSSPSGVIAFPGDGFIRLEWQTELFSNIEFYKIYRAESSLSLSYNDFISLGEISSSQDYFIDFTAINGTRYEYFVTSIDIYSNESIGVDTNGNKYVPSGLVRAISVSNGILDTPEDLVISVINTNDVYVEWNAISGAFDGYEIFKSIGNNYSFQSIGRVNSLIIEYTDIGALLKNEEIYYYIVVAFRNESTGVISTSIIPPTNSVLIGTVESKMEGEQQVINIDNSPRLDLANYEEPLRNLTDTFIDDHKHIIENGIDKRIELRSDSIVDLWSTTDYRTYVTEDDISGANNYIVKISGTINEKYFLLDSGEQDSFNLAKAYGGISPVGYEIDASRGEIIFVVPLYTQCEEPAIDPLNPNAPPICPVTPYLSSPIITLDLVDFSEVQGELKNKDIESVSYTQIGSGRVDIKQMPSVTHEGRINESLLPLTLPLRSIDNFVYSLAENYGSPVRNKMGTAVTFYDIVETGTLGNIFAATSSGLWHSKDYGNEWSKSGNFTSPVYRVFTSSDWRFYAITNYGVYRSNFGSLSGWQAMDGLEHVKVVRDIIEDDDNNIFISTDLGVFRLNGEDIPYIKDAWEPLPIVGVETSEMYGLFYDSSEERVIVSNGLGILQSFDSGRSWSYSSEISTTVKVIRFLEYNNSIFALSNNEIYRKNTDEDNFIKISDIDASLSRGIIAYEDYLYITTDKGPQRSTTSNINSSESIDFALVWADVREKNIQSIVTSLNVIEDKIYIGTDRRLFIMGEDDKLWLQYEQIGTIIPSVYINGEISKIGYYYANGGAYHNISFDEITDVDATVEVANKYDIYVAKNNGWSQQKYDSSYEIYVSNNLKGQSPDPIVFDSTSFVNYVFPTYDDTNAHKVGADFYKTQSVNNISLLNSSSAPEGDELSVLVSDTYVSIQSFLSQLYEEAKIISISSSADQIIPGIDNNFSIYNGTLYSQSIDPRLTNIDVLNYNTVTETGFDLGTDSTTSDTVDQEQSTINILSQIPRIVIENIDRIASLDNLGNTVYTETINGDITDATNGICIFGEDLDKNDDIRISIYGCTVDNVGELSHREVEDEMELVNSGLPSSLSQVQQINLVKLNTYTEKTWPNLQDVYAPAHQAKFISPDQEDWYDTLNSTFNYQEETYEKEVSLSIEYASSVLYLPTENDVVIGGIGGILVIDVDTLNVTEIDVSIMQDEPIRDVLLYSGTIWVVTENNIYSNNSKFSSEWEKYDRSGLPSNLSTIGFVAGNIIIGAIDGIYYKPFETSDWIQVISSSGEVDIISVPDTLFSSITSITNSGAISNEIYSSTDGYNYKSLEVGQGLNINKIEKHKNAIYVATTSGLYTGSGTFYSANPLLSSVELNSVNSSSSVTVNDLYSDGDKMAMACDDGSYFILEDGEIIVYEKNNLDSIHRILLVGNDVWSFGYNLLQVSYLDYPIRLTTGSPI